MSTKNVGRYVKVFGQPIGNRHINGSFGKGQRDSFFHRFIRIKCSSRLLKMAAQNRSLKIAAQDWFEEGNCFILSFEFDAFESGFESGFENGFENGFESGFESGSLRRQHHAG
jgi:hypothetical protein